MLKPQAKAYGVRNNLLMHALYNAELHYYLTNNLRAVGTIITWLDYKHTYGSFPYIIPTGGSSPLGSIGFVNAAFELKEQILADQLPEPDLIYVPCGSLGTVAGLLVGCKAAGLKTKIVAVTIEPEDPTTFIKKLSQLFKVTNELLHTSDASFPLLELSSDDIEINYNFCGPNYAIFTREGTQARALVNNTEGILLDGTYTAKAFAALLSDLNNLQDAVRADKVVLFWDTYSSADFSQQLAPIDYRQLPYCLHEYFEHDVQLLDLQAIAQEIL
jgi:1-aminocyclopropane-1-carboxylate deaminase/D-cysteine desulfhydrase-like pyridoxal-dependent ACC family enzyme